MPDPAAIRNALIAKLGSDGALLAQATNGVYYKVGPDGATRLVTVSEADGVDVQMFQGRAYEERLFAIEAQILKGSGGDVGVAAARIDTLLDPQPPAAPATLVVPGYTALMSIKREEPIDEVERDDGDKAILWFRRGGFYRVVMSL
jgi:hypothetical protein